MKTIKSQAGITLIEVLATITILSFLIGIVYNVFFNGLQYSSKATNTVLIQQEANYVLTMLKEQYQNSKNIYTISVSPNHQEVTIGENLIESNKYEYEIVDTKNNINAESTLRINPKTEFHVEIVVIDKNNPNSKYKINTILSKL